MQAALTAIAGVVDAAVTMPDSAIVQIDAAKVTKEALTTAVTEAGFSAIVQR